MKDKIHYDINDKAEIITLYTKLERVYAENIARITDSFTFAELKNLAKAIKIIAKGKA
jgi:hypothetical protein